MDASNIAKTRHEPLSHFPLIVGLQFPFANAKMRCRARIIRCGQYFTVIGIVLCSSARRTLGVLVLHHHRSATSCHGVQSIMDSLSMLGAFADILCNVSSLQMMNVAKSFFQHEGGVKLKERGTERLGRKFPSIQRWPCCKFKNSKLRTVRQLEKVSGTTAERCYASSALGHVSSGCREVPNGHIHLNGPTL